VLVVDDSRFVRRIIKLLLEATGDFVVVGEAADGEDGLAKARDLHPDVITLDVDMPMLDGLGMLHCLRQESDVPVVFVTGLPGLADELARRPQGLGAVDTVVKTFSDHALDLSLFGDELVAKLREILYSPGMKRDERD
jgi:two-component system chemotaxis response regulator CheB